MFLLGHFGNLNLDLSPGQTSDQDDNNLQTLAGLVHCLTV